MPINPDAVGARGEPVRRSWTSKDALLYAVGVGAGIDELQFTTENTSNLPQRVLPTFAVIIGGGGIPFDKIGSFNPALMVHGEQGIELFDEIPPDGEIDSVGEVTAIWDKGSAAVLEFESTSTNVATGNPLLKTRTMLFCRGEGGWGGDRGEASTWALPDRDADQVIGYTTRDDQALLYRLNGDRNPLHSDPSFAAMAGFDKPILHGLCTFGFTGRALLHGLCDSDPDAFGSMGGRFKSPVMPGETLDVHMWSEGEQTLFQTRVGDRVVFDAGVFTNR